MRSKKQDEQLHEAQKQEKANATSMMSKTNVSAWKNYVDVKNQLTEKKRSNENEWLSEINKH